MDRFVLKCADVHYPGLCCDCILWASAEGDYRQREGKGALSKLSIDLIKCNSNKAAKTTLELEIFILRTFSTLHFCCGWHQAPLQLPLLLLLPSAAYCRLLLCPLLVRGVCVLWPLVALNNFGSATFSSCLVAFAFFDK